MDNEKIKKCPFCGANAKPVSTQKYPNDVAASVWCNLCKISGPEVKVLFPKGHHVTLPEITIAEKWAVDAWNGRTEKTKATISKMETVQNEPKKDEEQKQDKKTSHRYLRQFSDY